MSVTCYNNNNDFNKKNTLDELIIEKFDYEKSLCPFCDYSKEGEALNGKILFL